MKIIYLFFLLFLIVDAFFFFLATPILKSYLQQKVSEQTKGLFSVNFDRISIELGSRRLALKDFELTPDTVIYNQLIAEKKTEAALYKISCSSVELWGTGVYRLFVKGKLKATSLKIINPIVELKKLPGNLKHKTESRDFVHEDLFPAIEPYLSEIRIKDIILENGKFYLSLKKDSVKTTTHAGHVSIKLNQFFLDRQEHIKKNKLFFSQELQIEIDGYKINLSDKIHYLFADKIVISTKKSQLLATNVGINIIDQSRHFAANLHSNYYRISAPQVQFNNFDIYNLYFNNDIKIGNILCENPSIELVNILKKERTNSLNQSLELDLSKLIKGRLNSIMVDTLTVEKGSLKFYYNSWFNAPTYKSSSITLEMFKFQLDEQANNIKSKVFYSDNISLLIDTFTAVLPDKSHLLRVNQIAVSSLERTVHASGITLHKASGSNSLSNSTILNIHVPSLNITGADFYKLYHQRVFNLTSLSIGSSNVDINLPGNVVVKNKDDGEKNVLSIITKNFLQQLNISNFVLNESDFKISKNENDSTNLVYKGKAYFELRKFALSNDILNKGDSKLFFSDDFDLKLTDYSQDLKDKVHYMASKSLEVSSKDSLIEISGFTIKPKNENAGSKTFRADNKLFNFSVIQAFIRNIDINKMYRDTILEAGSISIFRPMINIDNYFQIKPNITIVPTIIDDTLELIQNERLQKKSLKNAGSVRDLIATYFKKVNLQALTIEKAEVNISDVDSLGKSENTMSGKISAKVNLFNFDSENDSSKITYSDNISFRLNDYFSRFSNKKYQLKIKEASFSSRDSVFLATMVRFFPTDEYVKSDNLKSFWSFYAPEVKTENTKIENFLDDNILDLGSLEIKNPSIMLTNSENGNQKNSKNISDTIKASLGFKKIDFDSIHIENGVFGIFKQISGSEKLMMNTKLNLHVGKVEIDSTVFANPSDFISGLSVMLNLKDLHYQKPDSSKIVDIHRIEINTSDKQVNGDGFKYKNLEGFSNIKSNIDLKEIFIPEFDLVDFNLNKLILNKELNASQFSIRHPFVNIFKFDKVSDNKSIKLTDINLYDKIKKSLNVVDIKEIVMDSAEISLSKIEANQIKTTVYDKIYGTISNLLIDSLENSSRKILNTDDISLGIKDYTLDFSDNLYKLNIKDMGFSTGGHSIFANSINLNPTRERLEFTESRKKESNLNYLKAAGIVANGVNFVDLINNKQLKSTKIDLFDVQFQAYKNQKYPLDSIVKVALPLEYLLKSKNLIQIDTLEVHDSYLGYEIFGKNALETGIIDFTNINATLTNLTNNPVSIAKNEETVFKVSGYLLNNSLLNASLHFPLGANYGEYIYGATLDTFDLRELNPILENIYFVSIKDGIVNNINFSIKANEDYALGRLRMDYSNLKIDLISKKKSDSLEIENRGLFSMVANSIIRDSNPKHKGGFFKEGRIYYERNIYRPVFKYWTGAPLSGIQSTLGFKSKQLKDRLKIEKNSNKFQKSYTRKSGKLDRKSSKKMEKQIQKELKDESKNRKKEQRKAKKLQKPNPIPISALEKRFIILHAISA